MYCTEWISKSLWKAAAIKIAATNAGGMEYVAPDNVYLHNNANLVYKSPSLVMLRYEASHANLTMRIDD